MLFFTVSDIFQVFFRKSQKTKKKSDFHSTLQYYILSVDLSFELIFFLFERQFYLVSENPTAGSHLETSKIGFFQPGHTVRGEGAEGY